MDTSKIFEITVYRVTTSYYRVAAEDENDAINKTDYIEPTFVKTHEVEYEVAEVSK